MEEDKQVQEVDKVRGNRSVVKRIASMTGFFSSLGEIVAQKMSGGVEAATKTSSSMAPIMSTSHPRHPYMHFNNSSGTFKKNRRKELKLSSRRRQRALHR